MPTYPFSCTITNPGGETGTASGWAAISGTLPAAPTVGTSDVTPHTGTYYFVGAASTTKFWWGQTVTLDLSVLTDVDAGEIIAELGVWRLGYSDVDTGSINIECFDGSGNWLCGRFGPQTDPAVWTKESIYVHVPPLTRSVRISARGVRFAGTQLSAYYDDWELTLRKDSVTVIGSPLLAEETQSTTGWTQVSSTLAAGTASDYFAVDSILYWTSGPDCEAYRAIAITDPTQQSVIDSGVGHLQVTARHSGYTGVDGDAGRYYIEFYDSSSGIIGSRIYNSSVSIAASLYGEDESSTFSVPPLTRSIRFGLVATRSSGTNTDSYYGHLSILLADGDPIPSLAQYAQLGMEVWAAYPAVMQCAEVGLELWAQFPSQLKVGQVYAEVWRTTAYTNTEVQVSQAGVEVWSFYDYVPRPKIRTTVVIKDS